MTFLWEQDVVNSEDVKASRPKFWPRPRPQAFGLVTSGLGFGLGTFWPQPGNLIAFSYGTFRNML